MNGAVGLSVRPAEPDETVAVRGIVNAAMLEVESFDGGTLTLVACEGERILGAIVLDGTEILAVAVRPGRRGQGISSALVRTAATHRPELTAGFDPTVRPFYESLGFEIDCAGGRCRGRLDSPQTSGS